MSAPLIVAALVAAAGWGAGCDGEGAPDADASPTRDQALTGDQFECYNNTSVCSTSGPCLACSGKSLYSSSTCDYGTDYHTNTGASGVEERIAILAPHGGAIELYTYEIGDELRRALQTPYHLFDAHPTSTCIGSYGDAYSALHVTSTGYNPRGALDALGASASTRGVAIHGHGRGGTLVCVGGGSSTARSNFITCWNSLSTGYTAVNIDHADCAGITGTDPSNIVNRGRGGSGLQLEMPLGLRSSLNSSIGGSEKLLFRKLAGAIRRGMGLTSSCGAIAPY
ncbi:MAG TPA: poly-gamma-glutamate hydrolase family protein [Polyangiaceae bacterium]|nr:poly-gamma-glutamate hydrolase family protein [Polyangiaceae bacterium]